MTSAAAVRMQTVTWEDVGQWDGLMWERVYDHMIRDVMNGDRSDDLAIEWSIAEITVQFAFIEDAARLAVERRIAGLSQRWLKMAFPEGPPKGMLPPALPSQPDIRWSWHEVRTAMKTGALCPEDAGVLLRHFGKPSLGTHSSLLRRLEWIIPPRQCLWHPWVKEALWRIARRPICASVAKRTFHVAERDLQKLVPRRVENPHNRSGPPMRLYELAEVARIAAQKKARIGVGV